jgi:thiamine pyrophosphokinase
MKVLVVAAAAVTGSADLVASLAPAHDVVIAVDGGGAVCIEAGVAPDVLLGDFDSLDVAAAERLKAGGARLAAYPADKDQTDLELALAEARRLGAHQVTLTAASSGRLDHTLAAVGALASAADMNPELAEPHLHAWVLGEAGRTSLRVCGVGATLSLIALCRDARVSVSGVRWPLFDATLAPGTGLGVSNVVQDEAGALVELHEGTLLVAAPESPDTVRATVE